MTVVDQVYDLLTPRNIFLALGGYIAFSVAYQIIYNHFFHPLSHFPGPFWAGVTRCWLGWHCYQQDELKHVQAAHDKYGPVIRITPTMLLVSDHKKLPEIYHFKVDKSPYYLTGSFGETESAFNIQPHREHAKLRKMIAPPYSFSKVSAMEPMMDDRLVEWRDRMAELFAKTGDAFDFCEWAVFMAYDIVSDFGFGAPFGFVPAGQDIGGLIQGFHDGMTVFGLLGRFWPTTSIVKKTWIGHKYLVAKPEDNTGIGVLMRYRDKLLEQRKKEIAAGRTPRLDLLQTMLDARDADGEALGEENLKAEILLVLLAGADTTGTSFQAVLHYLFTHPDKYKKMMVEIDRATRDGKLSSPVPQYREVQAHLPYYLAVIHESMRLCPSAPNIFPRLVSEGGLDLYGKLAPAGSEITCNPYFIGRDKTLFGDDANEFKPERWLDPEMAKKYDKYSFVFGYGARVCLGKDIAMMEMTKGPLVFFQNFTAQLTDPNMTGEFIVHGGVGFWERINVTIKPREKVLERVDSRQ